MLTNQQIEEFDDLIRSQDLEGIKMLGQRLASFCGFRMEMMISCGGKAEAIWWAERAEELHRFTNSIDRKINP